MISCISESFASAALQPSALFIFPEDQGIEARSRILDFIGQATKTLDISSYHFKDKELADGLLAAHRRGVQVRLITEENTYAHNFNKHNQGIDVISPLKAAGILVQGRSEALKRKYPKGHNHARYMVMDGDQVLISTANFDPSSFENNRGFAITFSKEKDPEVLDTLQSLFDGDWAQEEREVPSPPTLIIGPAHQREKILAFLNSATRTLHIYQQYCNDPKIVAALKTLAQKGIKITLLQMPFPTSLENDPNADSQDQLGKNGVTVALKPTLYMHAKVTIVDGVRAMIGTTNYSPQPLADNREINAIIEGPYVQKILEIFREDLKSAYPTQQARNIAKKLNINWNGVERKNLPQVMDGD